MIAHALNTQYLLLRVAALEDSLKRLLLEFDFIIEAKMLPDIRDDFIFHAARDALKHDGVFPLQRLEFAYMSDGRVLIGFNERSEYGGWTAVGDVTEAYNKIGKISIGPFSLKSGSSPETINIGHAGGESGEFPSTDIEALIRDYYNENF